MTYLKLSLVTYKFRRLLNTIYTKLLNNIKRKCYCNFLYFKFTKHPYNQNYLKHNKKIKDRNRKKFP